MHSFTLFNAAALSLAALVSGHGVILGAQGVKGSPASVGFQVNPDIARNCTGISPCQQDTTIIRDAEIKANIVNECGRTELAGNIDIGENTENALTAKAVTQVTGGTIMQVTIHQVNADGAGPYVCDLEETGNTGVISQNLTVTNNIPGVNGFSQAKTQDFTINVAMPAKFKCSGASTGDVCTVRCRNNAVAGPFGGCFAVQQTGVKAAVNVPENLNTAQTKAAIDAQVVQNNKDLAAAVDANKKQGEPANAAAKTVADDLAGLKVSSAAAAVQTPARANVGGAAAAAPTNAGGAKAGGAAQKGNANGGGNGGNGGKNNNGNKARGISLKWAKRAFYGSE